MRQRRPTRARSVAPDGFAMEGAKCLYLVQGSPRAQLADALLEYRTFAAEHPDDPLTETLLDVSRQVRLGLREKRRRMRATGEPGKANAGIALSDEQREKLRRTRARRLRA